MDSQSKPRILLTGGCGFIGTNIREMLAQQFDFVTVDKNPLADIVQDLTAPFLWTFPYRFDAVFHLAGASGVRTSNIDHCSYNTRILTNVMNWADDQNIKLLINASSSSVYGLSENMIETVKPVPVSNYGQSKLKNEQMLDIWSKVSKSTAISLRLFNAIGRYQREDMFPALIIDHLLNGTKLQLFGRRLRDWTYVGDIVNAFWSAYDKFKDPKHGNHLRFNVGATNSIAQIDLIRVFGSMVDKQIQVEMTMPNQLDVPKTKADVMAFQTMFGWRPDPKNLNMAVDVLLRQNGLIR